ncbi:MAG: lysophospholipid acyltransferase family protein [Kofleriaceae bacterium]
MASPVLLYPFRAWLPAPIYWIYRAIRTVLVAMCFAGFWSGAVVAAWLWFPLLGLWPGSRIDKMRRCHRSMRRGFHVFHFVMHAMRLYHRTSPVPHLRAAGSPVVLVANHPTLCDVTSIASLFPDVVAMARTSFAENPLLGRVLRACGFVPLGTHMMQECEERLRMGFDVLVFPEGTRSPRGGGALQPFHRGAFELAARAKVPLVLLKLTCVPPALSKGLPIWKVCDHMAVLTVEPFATIDPAVDPAIDSRAMCRAIEQRYHDVLGYAPARDLQ